MGALMPVVQGDERTGRGRSANGARTGGNKCEDDGKLEVSWNLKQALPVGTVLTCFWRLALGHLGVAFRTLPDATSTRTLFLPCPPPPSLGVLAGLIDTAGSLGCQHLVYSHEGYLPPCTG